MKQLLYILIALLLLTSVVTAQSLFVTMVNQDPDPVRAGEVVEVRFKVENLWTTTEDEVIFEVLPEYPFTLYSGESKKTLGRPVGRVDPNEAAIIDFKLRVDPLAVDGDHEIILKLTKGRAEWIYDNQFFIDIEQEEINLRPYVRSSELVTAGNKGTITLELANAGESNIKFLEMELQPSQDYKLLSTSNYVYLGDLDSDDTESEDFEIYVEKGISVVNLPIIVYYEVYDTNYEETFDLSLNLLTEKEATKVGLIKKSSLNTILIVIAVILIGVYFYRRYKKKKRA